MTDFAGLMAARPQVLRDEADAWRRTVDALARRTWDVRDVATTLAAAWPVGAGEQAGRYVGGLADRVEGSANRMRAVPQVLENAADRLDDLQRRLRAAVDAAENARVRVYPDGRIQPSTLGPAGTPTPEQQGAAALALRDLTAIVDEATRVDAETTAALQAAAPPPGELAYARAQMAPVPVMPQGMSPTQIRQWWATLPDPAREALTRHDPRLVGNLDGIPATDRDRANRLTLATAHTALTARQDELQRTGSRQLELREVTDKLAAMNGIEARLRDSPRGHPPAMLLGFDPWIDATGRAIVSVGNPDLATNVATVVPGVGTNLDTVFRGEIDRADNLWGASQQAAPRPVPTATIAWLGYAPPSSPPGGAFSAEEARAGAPALARFQDSLRATHQGPPSHNTLVGHSYGTTTIGYAANEPGGLRANDVVLVGSPGMPQHTAAELGLPPPGHVYATRSEGDSTIAATEWVGGDWFLSRDGLSQGIDPTDADFVAREFPSARETSHSNYFQPGSPSLTGMGNVVSGATRGPG